MRDRAIYSAEQTNNYAVFLAITNDDPEIRSCVMAEYPSVDLEQLKREEPKRPAHDKKVRLAHTSSMNEITRHELDAKLEAIEARMDGRVAVVSEKIDGFLAAQVERDKAQLERDKRYELLAERVTKAAEGAEEAAKQAATVKSNYWAAVGVQLLAVAAIVVGAYFANQANVLVAMQTTIAAMQAAGDQSPPPPAPKQ